MTHLIADADLSMAFRCDYHVDNGRRRCPKAATFTVVVHLFDTCTSRGFVMCPEHTATALQHYASALPYKCKCGNYFENLHECAEVNHIDMGATL